MSSLRRVGISFLLVLSWGWIVRLPDGSALAEVKDETGMFSQSALSQADTATRQIKQKYGREMLVEVFPEIPAELRGQYSADRKDQFFAQWLVRRAQELKVNGVYVLICRNPSHLQVDGTGNTKQRAFTPQNIEQLKSILVGRFKNDQFDDGLLEGVSYVDRTFAANLGGGAAAGTANPQYNYQAPNSSGARPGTPRASGIAWYWWVLLIGIAIFVISRFLRSRAPGSTMYTQRYGGGGYGPGAYPPEGSGPQSGGFGRGMMGGLLGGMAGSWLYNKLGHRDEGSSYAPPPDQSAFGGGSSPGDDPGQGFTGGSGGDFGGGDAGGGGDSGGGGGDSGGSGGDF